MIPTIGRIVHYKLSEQDAAEINRRRNDARTSFIASQQSGAQVHAGNPAEAGQVYPLVITRVWNEDPGTVNGQVLLDGNDSLWVTSRMPGDSPGSYSWPVIGGKK